MPSKVKIICPGLKTEKFVDYPKYSTPSTNQLPPITIFLAGIFSPFPRIFGPKFPRIFR